jgi:RecA-family ATPase
MAELLLDFITSEDDTKPSIVGRGIIPVGGKVILGGATKTNKSFVVLNMAINLVKGQHLFGALYKNGTPVFPVTKPWRVLLFEQEVGRKGLKQRIRQFVSEERALGADLWKRSKDISYKLDTTEGLNLIREDIVSTKPDVVIFDPLSKYHSLDENSAQDMGRLMRIVDTLIKEYGCAVMFVHHTGLAVFSKENFREGGHMLRGSSAIFADVDTYIGLTRRSNSHEAEPMLRMELELRQGEPIVPLHLKKRRNGLIEFTGEDTK